MSKLRTILSGKEFHILIFVVGCLVFGWPLVSIANIPGGPHLFIYLFTLWGLLIAILLGIGLSGFSDDAKPSSVTPQPHAPPPSANLSTKNEPPPPPYAKTEDNS
ncbi:hypothetical protein ACI3L3_10900 [Desulfobaculum sp. SPO524]|uniref:hypothetical protein n=1 Tax=Desulfobaculum sp. SPO524 TaxID=3378071 RepID=UPI003854CDDB